MDRDGIDPGRSLFDLINGEGPVEPVRVACIGLDVLGGLRGAHHVGILHRDVKPTNVLITGDGRVVLIAFGLATLAGDPTLTAAAALLANPRRRRGGRAYCNPCSKRYSTETRREGLQPMKLPISCATFSPSRNHL